MKKLVIYFTIICLTYSLETATFILDNDMLFSDKWYTNGMEVKYDDYFFNKEKNTCIVTVSASCGPLWGGGFMGIYKKVNGKWILIGRRDSWIS